jgi:phage-related minor tail protein
LPLTRGSDGRLGIRSAGGGSMVNITMNISTPDVAGFRRSQSQIASEMSRAMQRGQRNL